MLKSYWSKILKYVFKKTNYKHGVRMEFKEIEYKYWASISKEEFMEKIERAVMRDNHGAIDPPLYVVSCDDYYNKMDGDEKDFVRFRKGGGNYELTLKRKERDNVVRKEINLNVSDNEDSAIVEFLTLSGYSKSFQVYKEAWIWHTDDCVLSYYTLSDGRSVIELEALNPQSVKSGVDTINNWHELLNLGSLEKESRSLYEIFCEESEGEDDDESFDYRKILDKISDQ